MARNRTGASAEEASAMRFRTLVLWVLLLAVFGWLAFTLAVAGWSYFITQDTVDKALREATGRHQEAIASGTPTALDKLTADARYSILLGARREGLPIHDDNVQVWADATGVMANVRWYYRILGVEDRDLLVIPIAVQRSYSPSR